MNAFDYFFEHSKNRTKDFVLGPKEQINYQELYQKSFALAKYISVITEENDKILLISQNTIFFLIAYLAILKSARICVPINPDIEADNLIYIRNQCNSSLAMVNPTLVSRYDLKNIQVITDLNKISEWNNTTIDSIDQQFNDNRCAEIIYTSGSTGEPKGVMISHRNLIANTESIVEYLQLTSEDIIEVVLPFYYCYGLSLLHSHLRIGGSVVLNNTFIFLGSVLNDLKKYNCTGFAGVPSHFQILLRKSDSFKTAEFPYLRYVTQAGGKLHNIFISEFMESHPEISFYVMYGQTEATARLSYLPPHLLKSKLGSIGKGIPNVTLRVVNDKNENVHPGEVGEIIAQGDNIMLGYLNDKESTDKTIVDGWLHTGDIGIRDEEGFIYLTARQKEIIKVGGKRVSPKEIEEVIVSIPEVIDCTVFGIDDDLLGEAIKATVIIDKSNFGAIDQESIKAYCHQHLSTYKIPQVIDIQDHVYISSTGKKIKAKLS